MYGRDCRASAETSGRLAWWGETHRDDPGGGIESRKSARPSRCGTTEKGGGDGGFHVRERCPSIQSQRLGTGVCREAVAAGKAKVGGRRGVRLAAFYSWKGHRHLLVTRGYGTRLIGSFRAHVRALLRTEKNHPQHGTLFL